MDPILYWNDVALEANRVSHTPDSGEQTGPPLSARALAMVHLAMYDALAGASQNPPALPPYLPGLPVAPPDASVDAAVAAAAHTMLSALYPSQQGTFAARLAQAGLMGTAAQLDAGAAFGRTVAAALLADRAGDPGVDGTGYVFSTAPAHHRVDPDNPGQGIHAPFFGARSTCFAVTSRHAVDKPPEQGDPAHRRALRQVRGKGIAPQLMGTVPSGISRRTPDETVMGLFWAYDGAHGLGTPPRLYNQIIRQVAVARNNTVAQNARLFALVNTAMADAGILSWEQKFVHDLWRPVVGIREDDHSMGPEGTPGQDLSDGTDPGWLPLGAPRTNELKKNVTPPFPAYPSGHATFGAAAFEVTRLFYGVTTEGPDDLAADLSFVSEELNGVNRDNTGAVRPRHVRRFSDGLWGMIRENSLSRVFLGVHWVYDGFQPKPGGGMDLSANIGGVPLGLRIARDIFNGGQANGLRKSSV